MSIIIQLDLSKAFDKVNHDLLLKKLNWYGVDQDWFKSYLSGRSHVTKYIENISKPGFPSAGVPQESILGPLLFSIFINDLPAVLKSCLPIIYADDTHLCNSCQPSDIDSMIQQCNDDLEYVSKWMDENGMELNISKCKFILIYPSKVKKIQPTNSITIRQHQLEQCKTIKSLGLIIDEEATWVHHINDACRRANYKLATIKPMMPFLTLDNAKIMITALCLSLLRYGSTIWGRATKTDNQLVDKCIRRCARAIFHKTKSESISRDINSLGWLTATNMYKYSICNLIFMTLHHNCPAYFNDFVMFKDGPYGTRYPTHIKISEILPIKKYSSKLTSVQSCQIWNNLPVQITEITLLPLFKLKLKEYLISLQES